MQNVSRLKKIIRYSEKIENIVFLCFICKIIYIIIFSIKHSNFLSVTKYEWIIKYLKIIRSSKHDKKLKKAKSGTKKYLLPFINKCYSLLNVITRTTFIISFDKFEAFLHEFWSGQLYLDQQYIL